MAGQTPARSHETVRMYRNPVKRRYYLLWLHQDLLGDWCVMRQWGSMDSHRGRMTQQPVDTEQAGKQTLDREDGRRIQRGYVAFPCR